MAIRSRRRAIELGLGLLVVLGVVAGIALALQQRDELEAADSLRLTAGESREAYCDGESLGISREDKNTVALRCYGDPGGSAPAEAFVLEGGQRATVKCDGTRLVTQRQNRRSYEVNCRGSSEETPTPSATPGGAG